MHDCVTSGRVRAASSSRDRGFLNSIWGALLVSQLAPSPYGGGLASWDVRMIQLIEDWAKK